MFFIPFILFSLLAQEKATLIKCLYLQLMKIALGLGLNIIQTIDFLYEFVVMFVLTLGNSSYLYQPTKELFL